MLAYSSIENAGIIMIAIALGGFGTFAAIIHIISHSFAKTFLFLTAGNIEKIYQTPKIEQVKGLAQKSPLIGSLWILGFLSIACLPPFLSFISEFNVIKAFIFKKYYLHLIGFLILTTMIIYNMGKAFFSMTYNIENSETANVKAINKPKIFILILFIFLLFAGGLYLPDFIFETIKQCSLELN